MSTALLTSSETRIVAYLRGELGDAERASLEVVMDADPRWLEVLAMVAEFADEQEERAKLRRGASD